MRIDNDTRNIHGFEDDIKSRSGINLLLMISDGSLRRISLGRIALQMDRRFKLWFFWLLIQIPTEYPRRHGWTGWTACRKNIWTRSFFWYPL